MKSSAAQKHNSIFSFVLIFLCFTLTSAGWISWNYHLIGMVSPLTADLLCMVAGYALQAAGIGLCSWLQKKYAFSPLHYIGILILYMLLLIPSILSTFRAAVIVCGLLTNLLCGFIVFLYLYPLAAATPKNRRGLIFGGGYAASTLAVWLLSLIGENSFLRSSWGLAVYAVLAAACIPFIRRNPAWPPKDPQAFDASSRKDICTSLRGSSAGRLLILGSILIVLLSMVKNAGFSFPTADIVSGVNLELSRIFYGSGLLIAGIIHDKNRRYGAVCTLAALILPFISMTLAGQPIPGLVFWALDYFFYGFFSVFRVLFFADLADENHMPWLAAAGLLFGRIGDALGTAFCNMLSGNMIILIVATTVLFILTVILFFRFYPLAYPADSQPYKPTGQERFDQFVHTWHLSSREQEVLRLLLENRTNSEIAASLFVSESTVKFHIHNILKKTGCRNRNELKAVYNALQS